ncbi:hypothetical protein KEM48_002379 [Puccinia striiformis f. sp. tritici PST-130]|nr:hypothetical protein KEM48_002379 [Puccinia striiformis f. sp. tritici PST-130]
MPTKKTKDLHRAKTARVSQKKKEHSVARSSRKKAAEPIEEPSPEHADEEPPIAVEPKIDPWDRARKILHVSSTPSWLPCREEEFAELESALTESIEESSGCCLYISGVPGTGKTATVHSVINSLQAKVTNGELNPFKFFEINGMKVTEPSQTFILFWEFISQNLLDSSSNPSPPKRTSAREALKNLEQYFNSPSPDRETCRRTGPTSHSQARSDLQLFQLAQPTPLKIDKMRLEELKDAVFVKDAIQWVSKTNSSLTGDVRKALDLCRSNLERVEKENEIRKENGEETRLIQAIKVAGIPEVELGDVISRHIRLANTLGFQPEPSHEELMMVVSSLQNMRLILNESSSFDYFSRIKLEVKDSDLRLITKNDKRFSSITI